MSKPPDEDLQAPKLPDEDACAQAAILLAQTNATHQINMREPANFPAVARLLYQLAEAIEEERIRRYGI